MKYFSAKMADSEMTDAPMRWEAKRPLLTGPVNYDEWKPVIELIAKINKINKYIEGSVPTAQYNEIKDAEAVALIFTSLSTTIQKDIRTAGWTTKNTAHETMTFVESVVHKVPATSAYDLLVELFSLNRTDFLTLRAYLDRLQFLWTRAGKKEGLSD